MSDMRRRYECMKQRPGFGIDRRERAQHIILRRDKVQVRESRLELRAGDLKAEHLLEMLRRRLSAALLHGEGRSGRPILAEDGMCLSAEKLHQKVWLLDRLR